MKKLSFLLILSLLIFSCKKDKEEKRCATDVASIAGSYKFTGYAYKASPSSPEEDWFDNIFAEDCEKDDILAFSSSGNYTITDAGIVCSPSGDDNGTWSLSGTTMTIDGDATTIESFDCKTLVLANTDLMVTGDKLKITLTRQ